MQANVAPASDPPRRRGALGRDGALRRAVASAAPALLYGLRLSTAVCLALVVSFWLQLDNAYWAATSAAIVAQPALGASLRKARFRAIGTVIGGIGIVLLTAVFPQDRVWFLVSLTLWSGVFGYLATILPNFTGYAAALAGYTGAIVFTGVIDDPENVFLVTVWRVTEIGIGIVSAGLVLSLSDFGDGRHRLGRALMGIGKSIAEGLGATLRAGEETLELTTSRRALIGRAIALDATIEEAIGEPSTLRHQRGRLQAGLQALFVALSGWRGIGNHLGMCSHSSKSEWIPVLLPPLATLAERDWLADPEQIRALCQSESRRVRDKATGDLSSRFLLEGVARVLRALEGVADALVATLHAGGEPHAPLKSRLYVADFLPALLNGLRIVLAIASAELIWIATSWPHGPVMVTFTAVNVILAARQSEAAYSWAVEFGLGCMIGGLFAAVLDLALLPVVHGGPLALSLALTLVLLPLAALSAGSWHKVLFVVRGREFHAHPRDRERTDLRRCRAYSIPRSRWVPARDGCDLRFVFFPRWLRGGGSSDCSNSRCGICGSWSVGAVSSSQDAWLGLVSARLAAMPSEASLEQEAKLLATLSVGEAAIALLAARSA